MENKTKEIGTFDQKKHPTKMMSFGKIPLHPAHKII